MPKNNNQPSGIASPARNKLHLLLSLVFAAVVVPCNLQGPVVFAAFFLTHGGLSIEEIKSASMLNTLMAGLALYFGGCLADRFSPRKVILLSLTVSLSDEVGFFLGFPKSVLYILFFVQACFVSMTVTGVLAHIDSLTMPVLSKQKFKAVFGACYVAGSGVLLFVAATGEALNNYSTGILFVVALTMATILLWIMARESGSKVPCINLPSSEHKLSPFATLHLFWKNRTRLIVPQLAHTASFGVFTAFSSWWLVIGKKIADIPVQSIGFIVLILALLAAAGRLIGGRIAVRHNHKVVAFSMIAMTAGYWILFFAGNARTSPAWMTVICLFSGLPYAPLLTIAVGALPKNCGAVSGVLMMNTMIVIGILQTLIHTLFEKTGSLSTIFLFLALILSCMTAASWVFRRFAMPAAMTQP